VIACRCSKYGKICSSSLQWMVGWTRLHCDAFTVSRRNCRLYDINDCSLRYTDRFPVCLLVDDRVWTGSDGPCAELCLRTSSWSDSEEHSLTLDQCHRAVRLYAASTYHTHRTGLEIRRQGQGLRARGQGQWLVIRGQGQRQGLVNWSSRTSTLLEETTLGYSEEWFIYWHISVSNIWRQ